MNKAEELKRKARRSEDWIPIPPNEYRYVFTEAELSEYARQESEKATDELQQFLREEFLLNTQNYPKEYHSLFHKKFKRAIGAWLNQQEESK